MDSFLCFSCWVALYHRQMFAVKQNFRFMCKKKTNFLANRSLAMRSQQAWPEGLWSAGYKVMLPTAGIAYDAVDPGVIIDALELELLDEGSDDSR